MMNKRDKIYSVYKAEFELVKEQSAVLLQCKKNGFNGDRNTLMKAIMKF